MHLEFNRENQGQGLFFSVQKEENKRFWNKISHNKSFVWTKLCICYKLRTTCYFTDYKVSYASFHMISLASKSSNSVIDKISNHLSYKPNSDCILQMQMYTLFYFLNFYNSFNGNW